MNYVDEYIGALSSRSCGRDLEYTAEFIALEQAVRTAETVEYGEHVYVAQAIDWPHVESLCRGLYEQTLDLRVMVLLTRALLERCGLNGFLGGLRLVAWLVRQRWESVHPQLVADDQFDPLIRINTLAELAVPATVIALLKRQVLARTEDGQALCLGDLDVICGTEGVQHGEQVGAINPQVKMTVPNKLSGEGQMAISLSMSTMEDFSPGAIARNVEPLRELLEARNQLANLLTYMDGKSGAEQLMAQLLEDPVLMASLLAQSNPPADSPLDA